MKATVSEKGQVTIPKTLRERLGIRPGQVLDVRADRGTIVVTKAVSTDAWESVVGILHSGRSTDAVIEELRGPVDSVDPQ